MHHWTGWWYACSPELDTIKVVTTILISLSVMISGTVHVFLWSVPVMVTIFSIVAGYTSQHKYLQLNKEKTLNYFIKMILKNISQAPFRIWCLYRKSKINEKPQSINHCERISTKILVWENPLKYHGKYILLSSLLMIIKFKKSQLSGLAMTLLTKLTRSHQTVTGNKLTLRPPSLPTSTCQSRQWIYEIYEI